MAMQILIGDCLTRMRELPDQSVHTCVTSPPYFGLRDYGMAGQIGLEDTPDAFVARLVDVFREVRRVLRDDGTLWLNLGDSYAATTLQNNNTPNANRAGHSDASSRAIAAGLSGRKVKPGLPSKNLLGIPWRVAFALQADGWYLRQDIIWHKPNPMPESVRDRCTKAHEYLFMLSKGPRYYYDADAVKEPAVSTDARKFTDNGMDKQRGHGRRHAGFNGRYADKIAADGVPDTRNRRSVWTVATKPFKGAHFATFPPDLIEPCILAGAPVGGTVLDPFGGSGTTAGVALKHGRHAILCELNPAYAAMMRDRAASIAGGLFVEVAA
jgi:DNA modification methylase